MAVTLYGTEDGYPSFNDELYYVATSTNSTASNFKYIFDIKIGGALVSRLRVFPDPASGKGICNVATIVRNYWGSYFVNEGEDIFVPYNGNGNTIEYVIEVGEDINGSVTPNLASGTFKAYNFVPPVFRNYFISYYANSVNRFITNRDITQLTYNSTEQLYLTFGQLAPQNRVVTFNNGVTSVNSTINFQNIAMLNLSPAAINNQAGSGFISDNTQRWTVTINGYTAVVNRVCNQYTKAVLHFLNKFGGFDTFPFRLVNRESRNVERKQYQQKDWFLEGNAMSQTNGRKLAGGNIQFAVKEKVSYSLNSDFVNENDYTWLRELVTSPEIYMEKGGFFFPAIVSQNNWTEKIRRTDKLFNLSIGIDLMETNSQYR